jgi:hypothetical protein
MIAGTLAERYLAETRKIAVDKLPKAIGESLRFYDQCPYGKGIRHPCLIALRFIGWRPLLAVSWTVYLWYRLAPVHVTTAEVESVFPILAWQLLFVHGITIGYHRERVDAFARCPRPSDRAASARRRSWSCIVQSPVNGPSWLHWNVNCQSISSISHALLRLADRVSVAC